MQLDFFKKHATLIILGILICAGFGIRIVNCYAGYPFYIYVDEQTVVVNAIDMIKRHSWEANVYNRPDHFEIKICAVLFQIISFLKYHVSADIAFSKHEMAFYLIARGCSAIFGTLMIPLGYLILEKLKNGSGLFGAVIVCLFPIFVTRSSYAAPDIFLTFMVMLVAYISLLYIETPNLSKVIMMSLVTGFGITAKYTCAICCPYIAFIIIYDCLKRKNIKQIFTWGGVSVAVVLLACFFIGPNLFTNIGQTIDTLQIEARSTHLGADGLGFLGNFSYYLNVFLSQTGKEVLLFGILGLIYVLRLGKSSGFCLILGLLFWVCTSVLPLHWDRWGMPIYIFHIIVASVGVSYFLDLAGMLKKKRNILMTKGILVTVLCLLFANMVCYNISNTMYTFLPDTRIVASDYCKKNGINAGNSIFDGYTPFKMYWSTTAKVNLDKTGKIMPIKNKKYIILSSRMYDRYYAEPERYAKQVQIYDAIKNQCELLAEFSPNGYKRSSWCISNVINQIDYICRYNKESLTGSTILIFKMP